MFIKRNISFLVLIFLLPIGCMKITEKDLNDFDLSIEQQRKLVLNFEYEMECKAHSLCFESVVDGALEANPHVALSTCQRAKAHIESVAVPERLPKKVVRHLKKTKKLFLTSVNQRLKKTEAHIQKKFYAGGLFNRVTCKAYPKVREINRIYDLQKLMGRKAIDCNNISRLIRD